MKEIVVGLGLIVVAYLMRYIYQGMMEDDRAKRQDPERCLEDRLSLYRERGDEMEGVKMLEMKILNGQVWKQLELPMFTRVVLMWECIGSVMRFVLLSAPDYSASNGYAPPLICSEEDGKMLFTEAELLSKFDALKYSLVDDAQYHLLNAAGIEKVSPYTDWV